MKRVLNFKYIAVVICCLPLLGFTVSHFTKDYRYSQYLYIYSYGVLVVFICWFLSFLCGFLNSIFILTKKNLNVKTKILWICISILPILYITVMLTSAFVIDTFYNDDITLPNGEKIDGYYKDKM